MLFIPVSIQAWLRGSSKVAVKLLTKSAVSEDQSGCGGLKDPPARLTDAAVGGKFQSLPCESLSVRVLRTQLHTEKGIQEKEEGEYQHRSNNPFIT